MTRKDANCGLFINLWIWQNMKNILLVCRSNCKMGFVKDGGWPKVTHNLGTRQCHLPTSRGRKRQCRVPTFRFRGFSLGMCLWEFNHRGDMKLDRKSVV